MLVLSRKVSDEVVFPTLGISMRVVRVVGNKVKLGITAPSEIRVLRGELINGFEEDFSQLELATLIERLKSMGGKTNHHDLLGKLNSVVLNLEILAKAEAIAGTSVDAEAIVQRVFSQLKRVEASIQTQIDPVRSGHQSRERGSLRKVPRLLVVDDNHNERELLKAALVIHGFQVDTAKDGDDAIRYLSDNELPNAVLLDMNMPRQTGETTLRCIRSDSRLSHLQVIGISGQQPDLKSLPDDLRGFDGWFSKPLALEQLLAFLNEVNKPTRIASGA